ncbi:NF038122 family metalloprotease [Massilia endophytica]|uniref:NF038122 family metalloprotease n=1 Tax=Massilia endophytica TaxID=2899220 RepID=UPI001E409CDF|nr:NF038122 family metalloprotease [Massilia endophytica]UGQ48128.1 NF038122 family metalloprotease [Massilia endophytica]
MKRLIAAAALAAAASSSFANPTFNFTFVPGTSAQAQQGFIDAGARWSSLLTDNVTINLTVGFNPLGPGILGQAASAEQFYSYTNFRTALTADITSGLDTSAVAHLPGGNSFGMLINRTSNNPNGAGSATPYVDNNGNANNSTLSITTAEAKALGLAVAPQTVQGCIGNCDGFIQFSSNFTFDFNPNDGIAGNAFDFVGVAAHEIGHTLGFISGVDVLDFNAPPNGGPFPDFEFTYVSGLDMFRYSAQSTAQGVIDWTADARSKYFSVDGGATVGPQFATGLTFGDGDQASHWKDSLNIGLMDPTAGQGELLHITANDLMAIDAMGWNLVPIPEPSVLMMMIFGLLLLGGRAARGSAPFRKSGN